MNPRAVLDAVPDPIMVIDLDHQVQAMNRAARRLLELSEGEQPPLCYELFHRRNSPCNGPFHPCPFRRVLETARGVTVEHVHPGYEGELRTVEVAATPFVVDGQLTGIVESIRDVTDRKQLERLLLEREARSRLQATHDTLTGVLNRAPFFLRLDHALAVAKRSGGRVAVAFLDLDGFKPVNDRFGHEAGDALLQACSRRLTARLRRSDAVGRLGGDEFAFLLEDLGRTAAAMEVSKEILFDLERPVQVFDEQIPLSASIGVAVYPEHGEHRIELLRQADRAMYRAKREGGQRVLLAG